MARGVDRLKASLLIMGYPVSPVAIKIVNWIFSLLKTPLAVVLSYASGVSMSPLFLRILC